MLANQAYSEHMVRAGQQPGSMRAWGRAPWSRACSEHTCAGWPRGTLPCRQGARLGGGVAHPAGVHAALPGACAGRPLDAGNPGGLHQAAGGAQQALQVRGHMCHHAESRGGPAHGGLCLLGRHDRRQPHGAAARGTRRGHGSGVKNTCKCMRAPEPDCVHAVRRHMNRPGHMQPVIAGGGI